MKTRLQFPLFALVLLAFVVLPISGRGSQEQEISHSSLITVQDSRGNEITLEAYPQRIISLSPNITETLFALGLGDVIIGRTDYCDYPSETASIPSMGDLLSPSIEKIVSMEPDIVIISNLGQLQTIEALEYAGIPVLFLDEEETMDGTYRIIAAIGTITGKIAESQQLIADMKSQIASVSQLTQSERPTVYYVAGFGEWGDFTATGDTFLHDIITLAGGDNIAADAINWSFQLELLHAHDPQIIILPPLWGSTFDETKYQFVNHPSYAPLSAVKNGAVVPIDSNIMERQGPRSAEAVVKLAEIFHTLLGE